MEARFLAVELRVGTVAEPPPVRRGLPIFLCCPVVQSRSSNVHLAHFASLWLGRWHLDLCFLQASQETRLCDGWIAEAPMVASKSHVANRRQQIESGIRGAVQAIPTKIYGQDLSLKVAESRRS